MSTHIPASREELKAYCKRQLGEPVIEINVAPEQEEDVLELSLQYFQQFHFDSVELVYLKHQVTGNNISDQYIELNDAIIGVEKVLPFTARTRGIDLFDIRYQIFLNDIYSLQSTDIIYYTQVMTQLQLINDLLVGQKPVRFNRHQNRLYIDMDWEQDIDPDEYLVVEAYRIVDPQAFTDVYNDMFLKRYVTALFKRQWGANLIKYQGVSLPGGITLDGRQLFDDAQTELRDVEEQMQSRFQLPIDFMVGPG